MALTFLTGTLTLTNWGFGAGDIAVLAGAGRSVGNWLMAQRRDRALLDFLAIGPEDILQRKGLVDTASLHNRWDKKLVLLKNGRRHLITHPSTGCVIENMDGFTWFMSLLVATLDGAVSSKMLRELITEFLLEMIKDRTTGSADYLLNEAPQHIMGWRSIGCVRSISFTAKVLWSRLAREGKHLPGEIPTNDNGEILRLLIWIASGKTFQFSTTSTDVVCLAQVLQELGLELLVTTNRGENLDENRLVVSLSANPFDRFVMGQKSEPTKRRGMRIPLDDMKECVSLWPGDDNQRNKYRAVFTYGIQASEGIKLAICEEGYFMDEEEIDVFYTVKQSAKKLKKRVEGNDHTILDQYLLTQTEHAAQCFAKISKKWPQRSRDQLGFWLSEIGIHKNTEDEISQFYPATRICLAELQVFLLGYYYTVLSPLLNTSQLLVQEAYGSWGWTDIQLIKAIRRLTLGRDPDHDDHIPRFELIRLLAYLFAGVDHDEQLLPLRKRSLGVLGKLALVTASLMGGADSPEKVSKFFLLDIDPSCIPSNSRGIVLCGLRKQCRKVPPQAAARAISLSVAESPSGDQDFSSHIEPDWGYDTQRVLVAYRDRGRIVHRINPVDGDIAVLMSWIAPVEKGAQGQELQQQWEKDRIHDPTFEGAIFAKLEEFHNGYVVHQRELTSAEWNVDASAIESPSVPEPGVVILANSLPKARVCLASMYGASVAALCSNSFVKALEETAVAAIIT